jgi:hypothetical protein
LLPLLVTQKEHKVNQVHRGLRTVGAFYKRIKVEPRTNPFLTLSVTQGKSEVNQVHKGLRTVVVGAFYKSIKEQPHRCLY